MKARIHYHCYCVEFTLWWCRAAARERWPLSAFKTASQLAENTELSSAPTGILQHCSFADDFHPCAWMEPTDRVTRFALAHRRMQPPPRSTHTALTRFGAVLRVSGGSTLSVAPEESSPGPLFFCWIFVYLSQSDPNH